MNNYLRTQITLYEEDKKEEASMRCSLLHGSWDQILQRRPSVRMSVTPFSPCSCHRIITKFSGVITIDKSIPWIWIIIYGHKLPYMKKTRKKKQVCGAACFMAAEIKFSKDVRLSVCYTFFTMFLSSYHHEIFRSYYHWQKWCPCKRSWSRSQRSWPHLAVSRL